MSNDRSVLIDIGALKSAKTVMKQKFSRIIEYYFEDTATYLDTIEDGLRKGDIGMVIPAAHTIKSSSRQLGANALADVAFEVETTGRQILKGDRSFEDVMPDARRMRDLFMRSRAQMEAAIEELIGD